MDSSECSSVLSSFVDTFVDFCVSDGIFLPPVVNNNEEEDVFQITHSPDRLIALGDLHGDLPKTKESLRLAGLIDSQDNWCGGPSTLVQVGDVLDRGGHELQILYFLEKLKRQSFKHGGKVITMNGNHEIMNVDADFRYVTPAALDEFTNWAFWYNIGASIKKVDDQEDVFRGIPENLKNVKREYVQGFRSRIAALRPNGPVAKRFLSKNLTVLVIGDSVFVHGGMLPSHVAYGLQNINQEVKDWISGVKGKVTSSLVRGRNSLVWLRIFSNELAKDCDCSMLQHVLETIPGARRMIMGHTIQESGINGVCDNTAIRIDVGMSQGCINGLPEVLEITKNSGLRILTSNPVYQQKQQLDSVADGMLMPLPQPKQVQVEA